MPYKLNPFTGKPDFYEASSGGTVTSVSGTADRITSTGGATPVIDIAATYVGQTSITTLGTITTGTWNGVVVGGTYGGTGINNGASTITLGGSLTTSGAFASTFTMTGITAVTFPTSGTLATTGDIPTLPLSLANGGTNANLTASNGGVFYSTATAGAILAGTATAQQMLQSGASGAPAWSTATYPASTTINQILYSSASNVISEITAANNGTLISSATGVPSLLANGTTGQVLSATTGAPPSWSTNPGGWVVGPASSTSTAIPQFSGTTGKLLADTSYLTVSTAELLYARSSGGASLDFRVQNTSNTASSSAYMSVVCGGASADDAYYRAVISGATNWSWGADNSDADAWVLSQNLTLGTNNVIRSSTAGEITFPLQTCFTAYNSASDADVTGDGTAYTVIFDTETADRNADYDNTTGIMTANVTGEYNFSACVYLQQLGVAHTSAYLSLVTTGGTYSTVINPFAISVSGELGLNFSMIVPMTATDTAKIVITVSGSTKTVDVRGGADRLTSFSGVLVC